MKNKFEFLFSLTSHLFIGKVLFTILIIISIYIIDKIIRKILNATKKNVSEQNLFRVSSMIYIFEKILTYIVKFIGVLIILDIFGVNTKNLWATAGIGTLIIGLGAQSIIKDFINGIFLMGTNKYNIGDYIKIGDSSGFVLDLSLRTTTLKAFDGSISYISNGSINKIVNIGSNPTRVMSNIYISYQVSLDKVFEAMKDLEKKLNIEYKDKLYKPISFLGITDTSYQTLCITMIGFVDFDNKATIQAKINYEMIEALQKINQLPIINPQIEENNITS